jgi:hypothetical protein
MKKKFDVVWEYDLDSINMVIGFKAWNRKKRPDLIGNPEPPYEMQSPEGLKDEYGRPCWLLRNGELGKVDLGDPTPVEDAQRYFQELSRLDMIKLLIKGIENKNDSDYTDFVDKINLL